MITIQFLKDSNGDYQVADLLKNIVTKSSTDDNYGELAARIYQVLDILKDYGVPHKDLRTHFGQSLKGNPITLKEIVKELRDYPPLLELKVNWKPIGAFRALFFYINDNAGNQTIYFTKAVIKQDTFDPYFETAAQESLKIMQVFLQKP